VTSDDVAIDWDLQRRQHLRKLHLEYEILAFKLGENNHIIEANNNVLFIVPGLTAPLYVYEMMDIKDLTVTFLLTSVWSFRVRSAIYRCSISVSTSSSHSPDITPVAGLPIALYELPASWLAYQFLGVGAIVERMTRRPVTLSMGFVDSVVLAQRLWDCQRRLHARCNTRSVI
jgi:hypothetical protein